MSILPIKSFKRVIIIILKHWACFCCYYYYYWMLIFFIKIGISMWKYFGIMSFANCMSVNLMSFKYLIKCLSGVFAHVRSWETLEGHVLNIFLAQLDDVSNMFVWPSLMSIIVRSWYEYPYILNGITYAFIWIDCEVWSFCLVLTIFVGMRSLL